MSEQIVKPRNLEIFEAGIPQKTQTKRTRSVKEGVPREVCIESSGCIISTVGLTRPVFRI